MSSHYQTQKGLNVDTVFFAEVCRYFSYFSPNFIPLVYANRGAELEENINVLQAFVGDVRAGENYGENHAYLNPPTKEEMHELRYKINDYLRRKFGKNG